MQILAIETELVPLDSTRDCELLHQEAAHVWSLKKCGIIREIWFTHRGRNAVVLLECPSEDSARKELAALPLVRADRIRFEVRALVPYDGFERLITPKPETPSVD